MWTQSALRALGLGALAVLGAGPWAPPVSADKGAAVASLETVDDFGKEPLDRWRVEGGANEFTVDQGVTPSGGQAVALKGGGEKACAIRRDLEPSDWRGIATVSLFVALESTSSQPMRLVLGSGRGRMLVRRFDVDPGGWREVTLRLADFRDGTGSRLCDLAKINQVAIRWDKGEGVVRIDDLRRAPGDRGMASARLTLAERLAFAFPNGAGKLLEGAHFALLTDAPALQGKDGTKLLERFEEARKVLLETFRVPEPPPDTPPVPVHVFATHEGYVGFVARLAQYVGAQIPAPKSQGVTVLRLPLAYLEKSKGWDQPAFVEEAVHGALCEMLGLASDGNWVEEGLPVAVRTRLYPQTGSDAELAAAFEGKGPFVAWAKLFEKPTVGTGVHAQLRTIFEYFAAAHAERLPDLWRSLASGDEPLHKLALDAFAKATGQTAQALEQAWLEWGRGKYPAKKG